MEEVTKEEITLVRTLAKYKGKSTLDTLVAETGMNYSLSMRVALNLAAKNYIRLERSDYSIFTLTNEGIGYAEYGLPEHRLINLVKAQGGTAPITQLVESIHIEKAIIPAVLGWIKKKKLGIITKKDGEIHVTVTHKDSPAMDQKLLTELKEKGKLVSHRITDKKELEALNILKRRNLISEEKKTEWTLKLSNKGSSLALSKQKIFEEQTQLTPDDIATGRWRQIKLKKYNISAPVAANWPGKKHPYNQFLDELKQKLISLGFKEMQGPLIELMFFNCDALFMPQDHPAREIHDIFFIKEPEYGDLRKIQKYISKVKQTHENGWITGSTGWQYPFSIKESQRLILRSHGTAISSRMLVNPELEIPGKYFSLARCYRPEIPDKTHLSEFNQVEGIITGEGITLRDLLGVLKIFALEIADAEKVKFKPDYFPFTEPSVELQAYKKGRGWMEFGGSGIFRPELTKPLGINCPVLAWGLGVDRLYMMKAGLEDIRDIFTQDLTWLRTKGVI